MASGWLAGAWGWFADWRVGWQLGGGLASLRLAGWLVGGFLAALLVGCLLGGWQASWLKLAGWFLPLDHFGKSADKL